MTRDYARIIADLTTKLVKAKVLEFIKTVTIGDIYDIENKIIMVNSGKVSYKDTKGKIITLNKGDILFIPDGKILNITYGSGLNPIILNNEEFLRHKNQYFRYTDAPVFDDNGFENFTFLNLEIKVFDSVNLFASLDIPPFVIKDNKSITSIILNILKEVQHQRDGKDKLIKLNTEILAIEILRHILEKKLFVEKVATNSNYFKDVRLINIFKYINKNLRADLSNKTLASIANVSDDYVGQYFKLLTGTNPQDYVEYKRMEQAIKLLRGTKKSISEIAEKVGFSDTAYFCRRFKMMFGVPPGRMRKRQRISEM